MTPTRRGMIGGAMAALAFARPLAATGTAPEAATVLAPGPEEGAAAGLARRVAVGLSRGLVQAAALRVAVLGGPDGITAANRFATLAAPQEGRVLLLLPGLAAQAQLVGDSRARYEPRHWPAVCGSLMQAVLAGRMPAGGAPIRLALPGPAAPEAAALLALDLLGRPAVPVLAAGGATPAGLVSAGQADALVLTGADIPQRAATLGVQPWLKFDPAREATLGEVPALSELLPEAAAAPLAEALRASAMALRVRGLLVLPALTSADTVALWRAAARRWAEEEREGIEPGTRRVVNGEASQALAAMCPAAEVALAYREWLARRLGWRAG